MNAHDELDALIQTPFDMRGPTWFAALRKVVERLPVKPCPTLGDIATVMREWKEAGVHLEPVRWVAEQQVWYEEYDDEIRAKQALNSHV